MSALTPAQLVGAWVLQGFEVHDPDPELHVRHPLGPEPQGRLIYSASGQMCALLVHEQRAPLGVSSLETAHRASVEAKASAFDTCISYAGRWWLEGEEVCHEVAISTLPELAGRVQRRHVLHRGGTMTLSYSLPTRVGVDRLFMLWWRRAEGP
ncbi:MAG: lipocalin-like domain-containing protein [Alphaproteobacteria bacterium]|nr:lipocalin-like domain-containing protein [Alphaproteobacteria bacterium]